MLSIIIVVSIGIIGVFGIPANSLVIATYLMIGFSESINISYLALGISDSGMLGINLWGSLINSMQFLEVPVTFNTFELSRPATYWLGIGFEDTTSCITAYIALERCLCVLFPLNVKRIVTRRKNIVVVVLIFIFVFFPSCHGFLTHRFEWKFDVTRNRTILCITITSNPQFLTLVQTVKAYSNEMIHITATSAIWIFTTFLIIAMKRNEKSRKKNFGQAFTNSCQIRNRRAIKTVIAIATVYLVFSTPRRMVNIVTRVFRRFGPYGVYRRFYRISVFVGIHLPVFNSGVNLFIYIETNSKFRECVHKILSLRLAKKYGV